jgi:hypothetical protein
MFPTKQEKEDGARLKESMGSILDGFTRQQLATKDPQMVKNISFGPNGFKELQNFRQRPSVNGGTKCKISSSTQLVHNFFELTKNQILNFLRCC